MPRRSQEDEERFHRVYVANLPLILGFAVRRCQEAGDAADIAAEVFLVAWRRFDDMPEGQERMWLFGIARRVLANQRRGRLRRHRLADRLRDELIADPPVVERDEEAQRVVDALRRLPEHDRDLLELVAWEGLTPTEIASLDGISAATVRSRLMRARNRLRDLLAEPEPAASPQREGRGGHVPGDTPTDATARS